MFLLYQRIGFLQVVSSITSKKVIFFGKNIMINELRNKVSKIEYSFLKQLHYWSSHRKQYGYYHEGRVWIYNTLENWAKQLKVSKTSIRRCIKSLEEKNLIEKKYLQINKRDRTLSYAINQDSLEKILEQNRRPLGSKKTATHVSISSVGKEANEHINEHMDSIYINNNKNKSSKSSARALKNFSSDENQNSNPETLKKTTIVQDMIQIWRAEFPDKTIILSKQIARYLVAAFKTKFDSSLEKWKTYLKTLKTSKFIMGDKFQLFFSWVIKFITIDRIKAGELGVKPDQVIHSRSDMDKKANHHIESVDESDKCKKFRRNILKILDAPTYISWFMDVVFSENKDGNIDIQTPNSFFQDYIRNAYANKLNLRMR